MSLTIDFLKQYLPFKNGIPSDDTFRRFFRAIDPKKFQENFINWVNSLDLKKGKIITIDGKTSRGSGSNDQKALHLISAFASEARIVLAQKKVDGKTNEITSNSTYKPRVAIGAINNIDKRIKYIAKRLFFCLKTK